MSETSYIHISEITNRASILKNGLYPSEVLLSGHLESFRDLGYLNPNESKMLYTWKDSEKNEKFIKDMVYCKTFITPRNYLAVNYEYDFNKKCLDFSALLNAFLYKEKSMIYDVYKINNMKELESNNRHIQNPDDSIYSTCYGMDERYSHDDKILGFSKNVEKDVEIVGQAYFEYVNGKYEVKVLKDVYYD